MGKKNRLCILVLALILSAGILPQYVCASGNPVDWPLPENNYGVPVYFQNDYPDMPYGDGTVATSGCGPACLAMVATRLTGYTYTPDMIAEYFPGLENNVLRMDLGSTELNLPWRRAVDIIDAIAALKEGDVVIAMLGPKSLFTTSQHFVVFAGIDENGLIMVNDPMKPNYANPLLARGLREGLTFGDLVGGYEGGWIYDVSAMEEPEYQHVPYIKPRYPHVELSDRDKTLLARVVMLEAGDKSPRCQQAIAEVLLNRLTDVGFSDYVPGMLYSENQYSGPLYRSPLPDITPEQAHYEAVENAISGPYVLEGRVVYFGEYPRNGSIWGEIEGIVFCRYF